MKYFWRASGGVLSLLLGGAVSVSGLPEELDRQAELARAAIVKGEGGRAAGPAWAELSDQKEYVSARVKARFFDQFSEAVLEEIGASERGAQLLQAVLGDEAWCWNLLASGPLGEAPDEVLRQLLHLWEADPGFGSSPLHRDTATALALTFAHRKWPKERSLDRYLFYRDGWEGRNLHAGFEALQVWERRLMVGYDLGLHGELSSQEWLRDNVKLPAPEYRRAAWQLAYRSFNLFGDTVQSWTYYYPFEGTFPTFTEMTRYVGGVCGRLSGYGAGAAVANGVPALTMGEPGHCAYMVRGGKNEWLPAYSVHWKRSLHYSFWNNTWSNLILTDRVYSDTGMSRKAHLYWWMAQQARNAQPEQADMFYRLALKAQPLSYLIWDEYAAWLVGKEGVDLAGWTRFHGELVKQFAEFPEPAWQLISKRVYPAVEKLVADPMGRAKFMTLYHQAFEEWGPARWNIEGALDHQMKRLKGSEKAQLALLGQLVRAHMDSKDYAGPVLSWGFGRFEKEPERRRAFIGMIAKALDAEGEEADKSGVLQMCSAGVLQAAKNKDVSTFNAFAAIIRQATDLPAEEEPGHKSELVSAGALVCTSSTGRYDAPWKHLLIPTLMPGFFHTNKEQSPWLELHLAGFVEMHAVEIVNRPSNRERAVPFVVEVSGDGQQWKEVQRIDDAKGKWVLDLKGKEVRGRFLRIRCEKETYLHLNNVRIYGRRLS